MLFHKITSTSLGIGYFGKGAGTAAAVATCIVWYLTQLNASDFTTAFIITMLITILGIWSANVVEKSWGKDNQRVVIDEVSGMCITLLWIPVTPVNILVALLLFRFFDILKPLFIKKLEKLPGGWGVMFDDILAGIYANIILQILLKLNFL
ncbi:phosphatidylglycerophosphatase A [Pedobacter sp. CG_S7]|uniref:phosphatidylglycerophosphatase A family protein n=1 Tax=Pedobacter sp. CG_S7 TaxID=3143930 RepID=UPI0033930F6B